MPVPTSDFRTIHPMAIGILTFVAATGSLLSALRVEIPELDCALQVDCIGVVGTHEVACRVYQVKAASG